MLTVVPGCSEALQGAGWHSVSPCHRTVVLQEIHVPYLAAIEVDHRQDIITATDKLKEMLGGSWHIEDTVRSVISLLGPAKSTRMVLPVSGAVWLASEDLAELTGVLFSCRKSIVEDLGLPTTFAIEFYEAGTFHYAKERLEKRVRRLKDAKDGEEGLPGLPLAASCQIDRTLHATKWRPNARDPRRWLVSDASENRQTRGASTLGQYLSRLCRARTSRPDLTKRPWQLEHFASGEGDQYIGVIKADGDGMGALMEGLDFTKFAAGLQWDQASWQAIRQRAGWRDAGTEAPPTVTAEQSLTWLSYRIDACIWDALDLAATEVLREYQRGEKEHYFPLAPIIRAGEDSVIVCRRKLALPLAIAFGEHYASLTAADKVIRKAREILDGGAFSLSFGVLYARQGYPFELLWEIAEDLQKSAKAARAALGSQAGFLDLEWFASTGRTDLAELRSSAYAYRDGTWTLRLTSRPWSLANAKAMSELAKILEDVPPARWSELEEALWLGKELSELAWRRWLLHLGETAAKPLLDEMKTWGEVGTRLQCVHATPQTPAGYPYESPWLPHREGGLVCPVMDLVELHKITR